MKLLADECCPARLVDSLRDRGHDVLYAVETMPGAPDRSVLRRAYGERRLLLTEDKDFGELVVRLQLETHGIILLRFPADDSAQKVNRLLKVLDNPEKLADTFVVIEPERTRFCPIR